MGRLDGGDGLEGTHFILGKGGAGKSAISQGLAALAAQAGNRTLLVRIGESLQPLTPRSALPAPSGSGFDVVDLHARVAMDEYVRHVVRLRPLVERITGSEVYRRFFAAAPGLPELVLLGRIREYSKEATPQGAPKWQSLIVDCPSSGHGLLMLETPFAAFRAVPVGPFARMALEIMDWLKIARIGLVATPEEMAIVEAIEFAHDLLARTGLTPHLAFLNRMRQESLSPAARRALVEVEAAQGSSDRGLLDGAARVLRRTRLEAFHHRRLARGLGLQPILVGELSSCGPQAVAASIQAGLS